eukprot:1161831-Pelagomonas_calceolata.AAC.2
MRKVCPSHPPASSLPQCQLWKSQTRAAHPCYGCCGVCARAACMCKPTGTGLPDPRIEHYFILGEAAGGRPIYQSMLVLVGGSSHVPPAEHGASTGAARGVALKICGRHELACEFT